jgi:hypothetical protein
MTYTLDEFRPGDRVELHPATDLWIRGARYGTVVKIGTKTLTLDLDRLGCTMRVSPRDICRVLSD